MDEDPRLFDIFLDVQRGLPRQGPGDDASTRRALRLCGDLPARPDVLDVGCGPGAQTLVIAEALPGARVTAVDVIREYLTALEDRVEATGLGDHVEARLADMTHLPFAPASFDLVWSEGAAYIMGVGRALEAWKPLLRPGGCLAFSELVWLRPDPPANVADFFAEEYPAMTDVAGIAATIDHAGYALVGHFTLPEKAWWERYYLPLLTKLPTLRRKYAGDGEAERIIETTATEIDMRRRFGDWYGYEFFVTRRPA